MTHKLETEMFSQKIEYSGDVFFWPLTPLFSFVSFHLNKESAVMRDSVKCSFTSRHFTENTTLLKILM